MAHPNEQEGIMALFPKAPVRIGDRKPLYSIGATSRSTGISMPTLRAWGRRYNFPDSGRTSGGHRLYSDADIHCLRWVKARIEEGMLTSMAIQALRYQETTDQFSAALVTTGEAFQDDENKSVFPGLPDRLIQPLLYGDLVSANQVLEESLATISPEGIILNLIAPALCSIGDAWEKGDINVATEHLATSFLRQKLTMWMASSPPPVARPPIVLACAPDEWHEGSLLILGALLRRRRWPVTYLGQAVPLADLSTFVRDTHPSMIVLVAMTEHAVTGLVQLPQWLSEATASGKPVIGYGGRIFLEEPKWRSLVPGMFLGENFEIALATIEQLLQ